MKGGPGSGPTQLTVISEDLLPLVNDTPLDMVEIILIACQHPFTDPCKCHAVLGLYRDISESLWHPRMLDYCTNMETLASVFHDVPEVIGRHVAGENTDSGSVMILTS